MEPTTPAPKSIESLPRSTDGSLITPRSSIRPENLALATAAAAALATIAGLGARRWPILDLATHFRLHGLLALTPGLALALARGRTLLALALGVPWLISAVSIGQCWLRPWEGRASRSLRRADTARRSASKIPAPAPPVTDTLRLAVFNVWGVNPTPRRIAPYLEAHGVDIAVIVELQPRLAKRLADPAVWGFEPVVTAARDDFYGIGIYARRDAAARGVVVTGGGAEVLVADDPLQRPIVTAAVAWGGRAVTLIGVHPPPPFNPRMSVERDSMLRAAGELLVESGRPGILCGDINAAPWSSARRAASRAAPLHDAARGHGYAGTWPSFVPKWLGIPIDVCLIDPQLRSVEYVVGPMLGSDHRPVLTTLRWR